MIPYKDIRREQVDALKEHFKKLFIRKPRNIPKGFPECYYISFGVFYTWTSKERGTSFTFRFPYDVPKRNKILHELKVLGWNELNRQLKKGNDIFFMSHPKHGTKWLKLVFNHTIKGSTCKQVQIGSETVTREEPIYEVVCDEGAEESAL